MPGITIKRLVENPEVIPILASWYCLEWEPYYGESGPGDAHKDLMSRCNQETLPVGLIAMKDGQVLGTVALDLDVTTILTPSIVGLLVKSTYRGHGVAAELIQACEGIARNLGCGRVYMSTTVLGDYLDRMGWQKVSSVIFLNEEQRSVYVRDV